MPVNPPLFNNPDRNNPPTGNPEIEGTKVKITLPNGEYSVRWFNPPRGNWVEESTISVEKIHTLETPDIGRIAQKDWVVLIQKN